MMPTMFLVLFRDSIIWWANAMMSQVEPVYNMIDDELARRDVHWTV